MENKKSKKILIIILFIVAIIIAIFLIHTIRNYVIISGLEEKLATYTGNINYHAIVKNEKEDRQDTYIKGNKIASIVLYNGNKYSYYDTGTRKDAFMDTPNSKTASIDIKDLDIVITPIENYLQTETKLGKISNCIKSKISSVEVNGKQCYLIKGHSYNNTIGDVTEIYAEKDTGLLVKVVKSDGIYEYEFEFDNVDDNIFIEPNISEYTIMDN